MSKQKDSYLKQTFVTQTHGILDVSQKREIWIQVAKEVDGVFKVIHTKDNVYEIIKLIVPYKDYEIIITESDTKPLKFEIEFNSNLDYSFFLTSKTSFERILIRLGKKQFRIGDEKFDNHYTIRTKHSEKAHNLFTANIINIISANEFYSMIYSTDSKKKKANIISTINRVTQSKDVILNLISLHKAIVDELLKLHIIR